MSEDLLRPHRAAGDAASLRTGLAGPVVRPAWMLGRQWQIGELLGDDAGTPVCASLEAETGDAPAIPARGPRSVPYDPRRLPLDAFVESERHGRVALDGSGCGSTPAGVPSRAGPRRRQCALGVP